MTDRYLAAPLFDALLALITGAAFSVFLPVFLLPDARNQLYATIATVSSILLAVAVAVRSRFVEEATGAVQKVYRSNAQTLRRNWRLLIFSSAGVALLAVVLFLIDAFSPRIAQGMAIGLIVSVAASFFRLGVLYWLADLGDSLSEKKPKLHRVRDFRDSDQSQSA